MTQIKKRRGGLYWIEDRSYLSVTNILSVIDKPSLRYWFGQMVYRAYTKDPDLSERDALVAPFSSSKKAKIRGTDVHKIIENWSDVNQSISNDKLQPYVNAFKDWMKDFKPKLISHEQTVINEEHRYAGTLDLITEIDNNPMIVDVKTSKDGAVYVESGLQLSAYKYAKPEIVDIAVLALTEKGTYTFQKMTYDIDAFLACKKLYEYLNKEMLEQVGYYDSA
jgi:hypothetical protein